MIGDSLRNEISEFGIETIITVGIPAKNRDGYKAKTSDEF